MFKTLRNSISTSLSRLSPIASGLWAPRMLGRRKAIRLFYAIILAVMAVVYGIAYLCHYPFRAHGIMTPGNEIVLRVSLCAAALLATIVMSRVDRRPLASYGLAAGHRVSHFGLGALTGIVSLSALMAVLTIAGGALVIPPHDPLTSSILSGLLWAIVFVLVGWSEEMVFRGYVFFRLAREVGPVTAAARTSIIFALAHAFNPGEGIIGLLLVALFGFVACFATWRTRSLWWATGMHAAWDWGSSFLFGAADSGRMVSGHWLASQPLGPSWLGGGETGPEGSLFAFLILGMIALIVMLAFPANRRDVRLALQQSA
jgi:membrane protease YdiL (CAAX protease family)